MKTVSTHNVARSDAELRREQQMRQAEELLSTGSEKTSFAKALLAALQTAKRGITYNPIT